MAFHGEDDDLHMALLTNQENEFTSSDDEDDEVTIQPGLRWDHVNNMDDFFRRIYEFHQRGGLWCIIVEEFFSLLQFIFVVVFSTFLIRCVNYRILFSTPMYGNITHLSDAVIPAKQCIAKFPAIINLLLIMAALVFLFSTVKSVYQILRFREISVFYFSALKIKNSQVGNFTWNEIAKEVVDVSKELNLCVAKDQLDQFDICSRIMRQKNYLIAMINKDVLPVKHQIPFVGEYIYFPKYYLRCLEFLFFNSPQSMFQTYWQVRKEVMQFDKRNEISAHLAKRTLHIGLITLICSPILLVWRIFLLFFKYTALVKREPGRFSSRRWSQYARFFLRDYNELDHIFQRRLNAAHKPSNDYMNMFISPIVVITCKNVAFFAGALLASLIALSMIDEDVIRIEGVFQAIAWLTLIVGVVTKMIPDENAVYDVARTFYQILANVHYCPDHWKGNEHKLEVRDSFANMFHMKLTYCLEELLSPFITPILLLLYVRPCAPQIIDFFRNYTRYMDGVGDVCSLYDVKRHGDPRWKPNQNNEGDLQDSSYEDCSRYGKTEISLVNFSANYPEWRPKKHSGKFLQNFRNSAAQSLNPHTFRRSNSTESRSNQPGGSTLFEHVAPSLHRGAVHLRGAVAQMPPRSLETIASSGAAGETVTDIQPPFASHVPEFDRLPLPPAMPQFLTASMIGSQWMRSADEAGLRTLHLHEMHARRVQTSENDDQV